MAGAEPATAVFPRATYRQLPPYGRFCPRKTAVPCQLLQPARETRPRNVCRPLNYRSRRSGGSGGSPSTSRLRSPREPYICRRVVGAAVNPRLSHGEDIASPMMSRDRSRHTWRRYRCFVATARISPFLVVSQQGHSNGTVLWRCVSVVTARGELRKVLFLALSVTFYVYFYLWIEYLENGWTDLRQIHREDVFCLSLGGVWMSRSKVKGQGHQGQISSPLKMRCNALAEMTSTSIRWDHSVAAGNDRSAQCGCVRFMFGKISLALVKIYSFSYMNGDTVLFSVSC